jgi:LPS-assembly lipoprotein
LKKVFFIHLLMVLCLLTSQCGFRLKSSDRLPPQLKTLYISSHQPYDKLTLSLKQTLILLGVHLTTNPKEANVRLNLLETTFSHSAPDITTSDKARTYTVTYQLRFELQDSQGKNLLSNQKISISRSLTINPGQTLYSNNELNVVKQEMEREIITLLLYRLESKPVREALR